MDEGKVAPKDGKDNQEDYTGAVCWLIWHKGLRAYDTREAMVDVEDFELLQHIRWRIYRVGTCRTPRVRAGRNILARVIMGEPVGLAVDHINRNTLDDRRRNLRVCTASQNNLNRPQRRSARSPYRGVAWNPSINRWQVYVGKRGERTLLGYFDDQIEAAKVYNEYAKKHYGPFAFLNPV